ncbi:hypothetical protein IEZ26_07050 [Nocardioides cavernae]|uniref:SMI1/KNR4 family protein n=1 Tax=Nocardioides cavernae TaxID=1921566 RepID=A0ABR8N892_9ACTN|nr:hypothetical protein [Nocardioides cavernae]MBD3924368.1 hypothetical protein [Nocardioides cavernae]MBM7510686.1 hypothetical protein [Nocardioides cavernae]
MTELTEALGRLEALLRGRGALAVAHAHPGLEPGRLQEVVEPLGLEPSDALREWFGWHDGAGQPGRTPSLEIEIAPGCELLSAALLAGECRQTRDVARQLGADPGVPWIAEQLWSSSWFPVLRLSGKGLVTLDLERDTVHVVWWDAPPEDRRRVRWPSLAAFVEHLLSRYDEGVWVVGADGLVDGDTLDFP